MRMRTLGAAIMASLFLAGCGGNTGRDPALPGGEVGIEVLGIGLMSDGDLARLDYRVIDYEAARSALAGEIRVLAPAGAGGLEVMSAGRLGPIRQKPSRSGKKQFMMFRNSGRALREGDTAILVIGSTLIPGIPVR